MTIGNLRLIFLLVGGFSLLTDLPALASAHDSYHALLAALSLPTAALDLYVAARLPLLLRSRPAMIYGTILFGACVGFVKLLLLVQHNLEIGKPVAVTILLWSTITVSLCWLLIVRVRRLASSTAASEAVPLDEGLGGPNGRAA